MREVDHPTWGSDRKNQVSAKVIASMYPIGLQATDHDEKDDAELARRTFEHRCALMRGVLIPHEKKGSVIVLFLDGHSIAELELGGVTIIVSPELCGGSRPTADIIFRGDGSRYGDLVNVKHLSAVLAFSSPEQIRTFIELNPSKGGEREVGLVPVGGSDGSVLAFAMGAALLSDSGNTSHDSGPSDSSSCDSGGGDSGGGGGGD